MNFDDFRKLATGSILFNLRRIIAPRMVTILYLLGLAAILLWAVNHFFYSFRFGFGNGLWGLLEIAVFGLLAFVVLRVACEAVIVFFRAHHAEAEQASHPRVSASLIDDVRGAIEDLADEEPDESDDDRGDFAPAPKPAPRPASSTGSPAPAAPATPAAPGASTAPEGSEPATKKSASTSGASSSKSAKPRSTAAKRKPRSPKPPAGPQ